MDLRDICRIFHTNEKEYAFFSALHRTFSKLSYILSNNNNTHIHKNIGVLYSALSDHHGGKKELSNSTPIKPTMS